MNFFISAILIMSYGIGSYYLGEAIGEHKANEKFMFYTGIAVPKKDGTGSKISERFYYDPLTEKLRCSGFNHDYLDDNQGE